MSRLEAPERLQILKWLAETCEQPGNQRHYQMMHDDLKAQQEEEIDV